MANLCCVAQKAASAAQSSLSGDHSRTGLRAALGPGLGTLLGPQAAAISRLSQPRPLLVINLHKSYQINTTTKIVG
jgi:hypothetical protein